MVCSDLRPYCLSFAVEVMVVPGESVEQLWLVFAFSFFAFFNINPPRAISK
jgi:hypothetical protein